MPTNNSCDYSPTQYNVQVGGASGTLTNVAPGTNYFPIMSNGASANPSFSAIPLYLDLTAYTFFGGF